MPNPFDQFDSTTSIPNPFDQFDTKPQDGALTRGITQAQECSETAAALGIGNYDEVSRLAAERAAYRKANTGTKEGNELSAAWKAATESQAASRLLVARSQRSARGAVDI